MAETERHARRTLVHAAPAAPRDVMRASQRWAETELRRLRRRSNAWRALQVTFTDRRCTDVVFSAARDAGKILGARPDAGDPEAWRVARIGALAAATLALERIPPGAEALLRIEWRDYYAAAAHEKVARARRQRKGAGHGGAGRAKRANTELVYRISRAEGADRVLDVLRDCERGGWERYQDHLPICDVDVDDAAEQVTFEFDGAAEPVAVTFEAVRRAAKRAAK